MGSDVTPSPHMKGPVAKFENGGGLGRVGPHFTTVIRGRPSLKAEPIRPFLSSFTNFATGPAKEHVPEVHKGDKRLIGSRIKVVGKPVGVDDG